MALRPLSAQASIQSTAGYRYSVIDGARFVSPRVIRSTSPVALITGITGQDGSYLSEFLLSRGYQVHGMCPTSGFGLPVDERVTIHHADLAEGSNLALIVDEVEPHEIYHLGAQTHVKLSFDLPVYTAEVTGVGTLRLLEAVRLHQQRTGRHFRFYQASSSEMFGTCVECPQTGDYAFPTSEPVRLQIGRAHV